MTKHEKWMAEHGRTYKDEVEKGLRYQVFKANTDFIDMTNAAGDKKHILAINKFADMTSDEFVAMYTGLEAVPSRSQKLVSFRYENRTLLDDQESIDWRQKGAVCHRCEGPRTVW